MSDKISDKMSDDETTFYKRNREIIPNRAKQYYKNKERLREQAKNKYRELSDEGKNIKREHGKNRYHNMSEEKNKEIIVGSKNQNKISKYQKIKISFFMV